jgi:hypothetical protein
VPANDPPVKRSLSWLSLVATVTVLAWSPCGDSLNTARRAIEYSYARLMGPR